jgi:hypothetical protein
MHHPQNIRPLFACRCGNAATASKNAYLHKEGAIYFVRFGGFAAKTNEKDSTFHAAAGVFGS